MDTSHKGKQLLMSTGVYHQKWCINNIKVMLSVYLRVHKKLFCKILQSFAACYVRPTLFSKQGKAPIPHFSPQHGKPCTLALWVKETIFLSRSGQKTKATLQILQFLYYFFIIKFCNLILHFHFACIAKFLSIYLSNFEIVVIREHFLLEDIGYSFCMVLYLLG